MKDKLIVDNLVNVFYDDINDFYTLIFVDDENIHYVISKIIIDEEKILDDFYFNYQINIDSILNENDYESNLEIITNPNGVIENGS